jgi:methionyl-tRNA formyltransferase
MSNPRSSNQPASGGVVVFGSRCEFSRRAAVELLKHGLQIRAIVLPGPQRLIRPLRRTSWTAVHGVDLVGPAHGGNAPVGTSGRGIPVYEVSQLSNSETIGLLAELRADVFAVCCFPKRIPSSLLRLPRLGALNVHPSLLPAYRGPDPLFWIYRNAEPVTGVTVHVVDTGLDTGPIVGQRTVPVTPGIPGNFLWDRLASAGSQMLADAIVRALEGSLQPVPQNEQNASYFGWPSRRDLTIPLDEWPASRVYHFCVGVMPSGYRPLVESKGSVFEVQEILRSSDDGLEDETDAAGVLLACARGDVRVVLRPATT